MSTRHFAYEWAYLLLPDDYSDNLQGCVICSTRYCLFQYNKPIGFDLPYFFVAAEWHCCFILILIPFIFLDLQKLQNEEIERKFGSIPSSVDY